MLKKLKKIALFTDGIYPYVIGGMQRHSFYLAKYFAKNGIEVDLYHMQNNMQYDINKLEFFTDQEKEYIRSFVIKFPNAGNFPGHYLKSSFLFSKSIFKEFQKNNDVDFIYAKGFSAWGLLEEKSKGFKSPPLGLMLHGLEMFQRAASVKEKLSQWILQGPARYNLKHADYVFSYGGKITSIIKNQSVPQQKIIEIPTGISSDWLCNTINQNSNKPISFLFIGRFERRKGIEELTEAIKRIIHLNFEFHFICPIPEKNKINNSKIKYHGFLTDKISIQKILHICDVCVCPSYSEGMPNVILEAMASGMAIMATNVGAVSEMVNEQNGWLMESPSVSAIEKTLKNILSIDKKLVEEKKKYSIEKVKKCFLWEEIIQQTIQKIEKVI